MFAVLIKKNENRKIKTATHSMDSSWIWYSSSWSICSRYSA